MSDETKYWHAECPTSGIYIDLKTTGQHDQDLTEVPVGCLACDDEHVAVEITEAEHLGYTRDEPDVLDSGITTVTDITRPEKPS